MTAVLRRLAAEFTGTGLLVAVVVGSGIAATQLTGDAAVRLLVNSTVTALGLAVLIVMFSPAGGAQFNPVVTAADWLLARNTPGRYSASHRGGPVLLSEVVATAGLLLLIVSLAGAAGRGTPAGRWAPGSARPTGSPPRPRWPTGRHHRPDPDQHLRRDRLRLGSRVHRRPDGGRRPRRRPGRRHLPGRRHPAAHRERGTSHRVQELVSELVPGRTGEPDPA